MTRRTETEKPRQRQRSYDASCYELAEHFLEDPFDVRIGAVEASVRLTKEELAEAADFLAQVIQDAIEADLHDVVLTVVKKHRYGK